MVESWIRWNMAGGTRKNGLWVTGFAWDGVNGGFLARSCMTSVAPITVGAVNGTIR